MTEPVELAALALVSLPSMTPQRLRDLLEHFGNPLAALAAVRAGRGIEAFTGRSVRAEHARAAARRWRHQIEPTVTATALVLARRAVHVWVDGSSGYPIGDAIPDRPRVLLAEGVRPDVLDRPRVAIVGTRTATPHGIADARELGAFLAESGVVVVSGMAIGIDGAAHAGALEVHGPVAGVVATGLDVEYPRRHRELYDSVRAHGVVISESAYGVRPAPQRFPVRNRIIAALADVVVVVEATLQGGARITAQFALEYGRSLLAIPGSRRNAAAAGTNALIADGAHPLLEWSDVLLALGCSAGSRRPGVVSQRASQRPTPGADAAALLRGMGGEAATPDQLSSRSGLDPTQVALALVELERGGWVERSQGAIWPR